MNKKILNRAFSITYRQIYPVCICGKKLMVGYAGRCDCFREIWQINYDTLCNFIRKKIVRDGYTSEEDFNEKVD